MTPTLDELRAALKIDRHNLDGEIEAQSSLFLQAAELAALARSKLDMMESNLKLLEAELYKEARLNPEIGATENALAMQMRRNPQRITAHEAYLAQKLKVERREQLRDAFRQRGFMLRDLVALFIGGYYGDAMPRPDSASRARDAQADYVREKQTEMRRARQSED